MPLHYTETIVIGFCWHLLQLSLKPKPLLVQQSFYGAMTEQRRVTKEGQSDGYVSAFVATFRSE